MTAAPPRPAIFISTADAARLRALTGRTRAARDPAVVLLAEELARANVCPASDMPARVVRIGSRVRYRDVRSGEAAEVRIVMPDDAAPERGAVSVAGLPGAALIGVPEEQRFRWRGDDGELHELEVVQVLDDYIWR